MIQLLMQESTLCRGMVQAQQAGRGVCTAQPADTASDGAAGTAMRPMHFRQLQHPHCRTKSFKHFLHSKSEMNGVQEHGQTLGSTWQ